MRSVLPIIALVCAGCSGMPASPSSTALTGPWRIVSIQAATQPLQPAPTLATYQLTFDAGRVSARLDCNICNGTVASSGSAVTIGPVLACTRAACATMSFESIVVALLPGEHTVTATGSGFALGSARGVITLADP